MMNTEIIASRWWLTLSDETQTNLCLKYGRKFDVLLNFMLSYEAKIYIWEMENNFIWLERYGKNDKFNRHGNNCFYNKLYIGSVSKVVLDSGETRYYVQCNFPMNSNDHPYFSCTVQDLNIGKYILQEKFLEFKNMIS